MTDRLKIIAVPLTLCVCMVGAEASGQVYRCIEAGTTVFSDLPCSENAERYDSTTGISVVNAAEGLDDVARRNKAFVEQRQHRLAALRERAAERRRQNERNRQRRAAAEDLTRDRTVIGPLAGSRFAGDRRLLAGRQAQAGQQQQQSSRQSTQQREDALQRRRTLLSRSGGNQRRILR